MSGIGFDTDMQSPGGHLNLKGARADFGIRMGPGHSAPLCAQVFARSGRIHIPRFLREPDAARLYEALNAKTPRKLTVIHGDYFYDVTQDYLDAMTPEQRAAFDAEVNAFAARQYEGRYSTCRLSDRGEPYEGGSDELTELTKFLNSGEFIDFIRQVTGRADVDFCDAQATCYAPGDFLHPHYDVQEEKGRLLAYVLNLTPMWRVEWGGLLGFIGADNHLDRAYTPAWNAFNLFDVTHLHFVSNVAQFAPRKRYSITGWLRRT